jgi:hypothetical protein
MDITLLGRTVSANAVSGMNTPETIKVNMSTIIINLRILMPLSIVIYLL